ncbi:MAG: glycine oxidase ThiO [Sulfuricella denitrificans]|nr:glycine oxidase ThiO [Sulfuricella denitrificans]
MSFDVGIIGGGVIGCATALSLAQSGARVLLVEKHRIGRESSWAGGGILYPLLPWDYSEAVTRLTERSLELFPAWASQLTHSSGIDPEFQQCGMLVLAPFSADTAQAWCDAHATQMSVTSGNSVISALEQDNEALWLPGVNQVRNPRLLKALHRSLNALGVKIVQENEITAWETHENVVSGIKTSHGVLRAENYIVTAGAWSKSLLSKHALDLDIRPVRGQMLLFKAEPGLLQNIILKNGIYLIPRLDGHILVGSTLEDAGFNKATTEEARSMLYDQAIGILPLLKNASLVLHWSGLRPGSPDNIPTIDRHPVLKNLYINSGHFRYGVTMSPASAEIMTNMILGRHQSMDITPYRWPVSAK